MRRPIRHRMIGLIVGISLGGCALVATSSYISARYALEESIAVEFETMRVTKQFFVTRFLDRLRLDTRALVRNPWYVEQVKQLSTQAKSLGTWKLTESQLRTLEDHYRLDNPGRMGDSGREGTSSKGLMARSDRGRAMQFRHVLPASKREGAIPAGSSEFDRTFDRLASFANDLLHHFNFVDLRIVEPKEGVTIFSNSREFDLGTSLFEGDLARTKLAATVKDVVANPRSEVVRIVDFELFRPSFFEPSAFFVAPVFDGETLIAITALRLTGKQLTAIVSTDQGNATSTLGSTGEVFLVGDDAKMRTESRFFREDKDRFFRELRTAGISESVIGEIDRYGTTIATLPRQSSAVGQLFAKGELIGTEVGYLGTPVIVNSAILKVPDVRWGIVALIQREEVLAPVRELRNRLIGTLAVVALISIILGMCLGVGMVSPIERMTMAARSLASGFHDVRVSVSTGDELETLGHSFNEMAAIVETERNGFRKLSHENDCLLETVMPPDLVARLWGGPQVANGAGFHGTVSVSYTKIHGVSSTYRTEKSEVAIDLVDGLSRILEESAAKFGIRTLVLGGGSCFAMCGLDECEMGCTERMVRYADEVQSRLMRFDEERRRSYFVTTGIHSGPISSGLIGYQEFFRKLWRPTLNMHDLMNDSSAQFENRIILTQSAFDEIDGAMAELEIGTTFTNGDSEICRKIWLIR